MSDESELTMAELLGRINAGWDELQNALAGLDEAGMSRVDPTSGWAVTDHLAHLAAWERGIAYLLTGRPRYEGMGITAEQWGRLTMDEMNEEIVRHGRERSAAEAIAYSRLAHDDMLNALAGLGDADLRRDYADFDPGSEPSGRPIVGWIVGDTYDHYHEHLDYIRSAFGR